MKHILGAVLGTDVVLLEIDEYEPEFSLSSREEGEILRDQVLKFYFQAGREIQIHTRHQIITLGGLTPGAIKTLEAVWARWEAPHTFIEHRAMGGQVVRRDRKYL